MKKKKKHPKFNIFCKLIALCLLITSVICIGTLIYMNMVPTKYIVYLYFIGIPIIIFLFIFLFFRRVKLRIKIFSLIISLILISIFTLGSIYLTDTVSFIKNLTNTNETIKYYVLVLKDSEYKAIKDLEDDNIGTYKGKVTTYNKGLNKLNKLIDIDNEEYNDIELLYNDLVEEKIDSIFLSSSQMKLLSNIDPDYENNIRVLYEILIKNNNSNSKDVDVTKESFNIYISGMDSYDSIHTTSHSDTNMILTINPRTNKILMTSIPRDYYIDVHGEEEKDKLTHTGMYEIDVTTNSVEDLLDIDINYYVKVNFSTLVELIDIIGDIEVESDEAFCFSLEPHYCYKKGINTLSGEEALAFSRERKSFAEGDRIRGENQKKVLSAIINKVSSSKTIITKYKKILNSVSDDFATNMSEDRIYSLIKMQLNKMPSWSLDSYALSGTDSREYTYSTPKTKLYVMVPDDESVTEAHNKIVEILNAE